LKYYAYLAFICKGCREGKEDKNKSKRAAAKGSNKAAPECAPVQGSKLALRALLALEPPQLDRWHAAT